MQTFYDIIVTMDTTNETVYTTMNSMMNSTINSSELPPVTNIYSQIYLNSLIISIIVLMIVSIVGNTMIILATILYKPMRTKTNIAILNLAVADIGVTVLDMPVSLISVLKVGEDWIPSNLCDINAFFNALFLIASIHSLMYISVHKYFSLVKPLDRFVTKRRTIAMIIVAWSTGFACGIGPIFGWTSNEFKYEQGATQCGPMYPETPKEKSHGLFVFVVGLLVPLLVLFFTYTAIFIEVHRFSNRLRMNTSVAEMIIFKQKIRITVTLFIIVVAFLMCWLPYMTYATWAIVKGYENIPVWFNSFAYWSGYLSCALNPIIYAWRTKTFRTAFLNIIHCKSKMDKVKIAAELSPHFPKKFSVVGALVTGYPVINHHPNNVIAFESDPDIIPQSPTDDDKIAASSKNASASISVYMANRISKSSWKKFSRKEDRRKLFGKNDEHGKENLKMENVGCSKEPVRSFYSCPGAPSGWTFDGTGGAPVSRWSFDGLDVHRQFSI